MQTNLTVGKIGEDIAVEYLTLHKYHVLYRNYRERFGELDIVAKNLSDVLVIVEVKTLVCIPQQIINSISSPQGESLMPEDEMTASKIIKLKRTAEYFTRKHPELIKDSKGWQIDVIAIDIPSNVFNSSDPKMLLSKIVLRHYYNV